MGWTPSTLTDLANTLAKAGLPLARNLRFMDIGSQDVFVRSEAERKQLILLIEQQGGAPKKVPNAAMFPVRAFFEACAVDYWCIDIDERPKTIWVDLNTGKFPSRFRGNFDVVCNAGTTEHVANPVMALFVIHQLARCGAILFHDVPMNGFGNHGFLNYTPKLWHTVHWMNRYELLHARIRRVDEANLDINNFRPAHMSYFEGLETTNDASSILQIVFRKTADHVFRPPLDMWTDMTRSQFRRCVEAALEGYIQTGVVTPGEVRTSVTDLVSSIGGLRD